MSGGLDNLLTVITPTHNRSPFLKRQLLYLLRCGFPFAVHVVDSSDDEARSINRRTVAEAAGGLRLRYSHSHADFITKCRSVLETTATPYVVFCADDDFLMADAARPCVEFLERHPEYAVAQGLAVNVNTRRRSSRRILPGYSIEDADPVRRFASLARHWFSTFYSVYRTPQLYDAFRLAEQAADFRQGRIFSELALSNMSVIQGKVKCFPRVQTIVQEHDGNESRLSRGVASESKAAELYVRYRERVAQELAGAAGIERGRAAAIIDRCFGYLRNGGDSISRPRRTRWEKWLWEARRPFLQIRAQLQKDEFRYCKKISSAHPLLQAPACRLAQELIADYPAGITAEQVRLTSIAS